MVNLICFSDEYGEESFPYDTMEDAMKGQLRIMEKGKNDGVIRSFRIVEETGMPEFFKKWLMGLPLKEKKLITQWITGESDDVNVVIGILDITDPK